MRRFTLATLAVLGLQLSLFAVGKDSLGPNGVFQRKVSVGYGEECTFSVTKLSKRTAVDSISVVAEYTWSDGGTNCTGRLELQEKTTTYDDDKAVSGFFALLTATDWESVPRVAETVRLDFVCTVSGYYDSVSKSNNKFEFAQSAGRGGYPKELPHGMSESDPVRLRPSTSKGSVPCDVSSRYFKGTCYLSANLSAGHKYLFGIEGDTAYPMSMYLKGETNDLFATAEDYREAWPDCAVAYAVVPQTNGTYLVRVGCETNSFAFAHAAVPFLKPAQHPHGVVSPVRPAVVVPGYLNDPESGAFDNVIDQCLFSFADYAKGDCLVFSVTNAGNVCSNLLLRLYDSAGNVLGESRRVADGAFAGRVSWLAASSGSASKPLYVGVCQELAPGETPTAGPVVLSVSRVELGERVSLVTAVPDDTDRSPLDCPEAVATEPRSLGVAEWGNVFALPARAGLTYRVKARLATGGSDNGYALKARAYVLSGTTKRPLAVNLVTDSGRIDPKAEGWWEIFSDTCATVYVEVSLADGDWGSGQGLDYGPYELCVTGAGPGNLGMLKADMSGAAEGDMGWKIVSGPAVAGIVPSKEPYYPAGSSVILPVGGPYAVAAKSVKDFKKVDPKGYDANVYVVGGGAVDAPQAYRYFDTVDPADDGPETKSKIAASSGKDVEVVRSLWNDYEGSDYRDTNDWFVVSANEGAFYRFSLPWTSAERATEVRVFGPDDWTTECAYNVYADPSRSVRIAAERKGTYYVRVSNCRPDASTNCAYKLRTLMTTPGTVRFAKAEITVKDTDAYANITVNRTGKDGRIRVKYYTVAGEAQPGRDYYPVPKSDPAVLIWENGDNKAKTVRIKLIPDIVTSPTGVAKSFKVQFETYGWDEIDAANEYVPNFDLKTGDAVTVQIAETKKKVAGTVRVVGDNPKKPVFDVVAGDELEIPLERVLGTNGVVGVVATTVKGTANRSGETDFEPVSVTNVWPNGVGGRASRTLVIRTKRVPADYTAKKTFTVKLTALASKKGDDVQFAKPTLAASTITVNVLNDKFGLSVADWAKAKTFPRGVLGVKEGKAGSWFCTDVSAAELFARSPESPADISFTLSGPGRFVYTATDVSCPEDERVHTVTNWISKGSETLKLTNLSHIHSYAYVPLPAAEPVVPLVDKSTVRSGRVEFRFARGADDASDGIAYRVYALSDGATRTDLSGRAVKCKLGDAETEVGFDGTYATNVWYDAVNKGRWSWRVDSFFVGGPVTNAAKSVWSFGVVDESKLPFGAEPAVTQVRGRDAYGNGLDVVGGARVVLHRLVKVDFAVGAPGSSVSAIAGRLPAGLSLKAVKRPDGIAQYRLSGTPTKSGDALVILQETADKVKGATTALAITVEDSGRPEGSFVGLATVADSGSVGQMRQAVASVSFTAASNGKLSAKVLIGGAKYAFSDTGYACARTNDEGQVVLEATLRQSQKAKQNGVQAVFTNELRLAVLEAPSDDERAWSCVEPGLSIRMRALPDLQGDGYRTDVNYSGTLVRDNAKVKDWVAAAGDFSGYYTVALVPDTTTEAGGRDDNLPNGNGYLTMTLSAKGTAKVSGALADGSSFSASLPVAFAEADGERSVMLPLYVAKGKSVLSGWAGVLFPDGRAPVEPMTGSWTDDVPVVQPLGDTGVVWFNDDSGATYDGQFGYEIAIHPVGGWYDSLVNLQRHYVEDDGDHVFTVDTATVDELWQISDLIGQNVGPGFDLASGAMPYGLPVDIAVNDLIVEKQSLVKDSTKTYYSWDDCVNPAKVTLTFKRATGVLTGTCNLWYEGVDANGALKQKYYSGCRHAGIFLMCRGEDDLLGDDVVTAGALVVPQKIKLPGGSTRSWNANFRFNVKSAGRPLSWEEE